MSKRYIFESVTSNGTKILIQDDTHNDGLILNNVKHMIPLGMGITINNNGISISNQGVIPTTQPLTKAAYEDTADENKLNLLKTNVRTLSLDLAYNFDIPDTTAAKNKLIKIFTLYAELEKISSFNITDKEKCVAKIASNFQLYEAAKIIKTLSQETITEIQASIFENDTSFAKDTEATQAMINLQSLVDYSWDKSNELLKEISAKTKTLSKIIADEMESHVLFLQTSLRLLNNGENLTPEFAQDINTQISNAYDKARTKLFTGNFLSKNQSKSYANYWSNNDYTNVVVPHDYYDIVFNIPVLRVDHIRIAKLDNEFCVHLFNTIAQDKTNAKNWENAVNVIAKTATDISSTVPFSQYHLSNLYIAKYIDSMYAYFHKIEDMVKPKGGKLLDGHIQIADKVCAHYREEAKIIDPGNPITDKDLGKLILNSFKPLEELSTKDQLAQKHFEQFKKYVAGDAFESWLPKTHIPSSPFMSQKIIFEEISQKLAYEFSQFMNGTSTRETNLLKKGDVFFELIAADNQNAKLWADCAYRTYNRVYDSSYSNDPKILWLKALMGDQLVDADDADEITDENLASQIRNLLSFDRTGNFAETYKLLLQTSVYNKTNNSNDLSSVDLARNLLKLNPYHTEGSDLFDIKSMYNELLNSEANNVETRLEEFHFDTNTL